MKIVHGLWIVLIAIVTFVSCHKDADKDFEDDEITTFQPKVYQEIIGSIAGYVYDESGLPVADAQVAIYSTTTRTNAHGIFYIKNAKMDRQGTYLRVQKNGFFLGSDFVYPLEDGAAYSRIKMLTLDKSQSFTASIGGEISMLQGGKVIFPDSAIANANGTAYHGKVFVSSRFLNPNQSDMGDMMPGGLMADGANGNTYVLATLGMAAIELHDADGKSLNILKGKKATIEMPAVTGYNADEVPFWYFDELKGRWQEEGKAILKGNSYVAQVSHFSFWNLDVPYPLVELCGQVLYENGKPAQNINVTIEAAGLGTRYGYINENGKFCGKVPKGVQLKIKIHSSICNKILKETTIGPLTDDTQINQLIVDKIDVYSIAGVVTCQGTAPDEGIVVLKVNDKLYPFVTDKNGAFDINISALVCNPNDKVSVFGFDNKSNKTSTSLTLIEKTNHDLNLEICEVGCPLDGNIVFDCDVTMSVQIISGSGQYTYLWENKATTSNITIPQFDLYNPKTYCVTVTDIGNNCSKTFCNLFSKPDMGIETDCQAGIIYAYPGGGQQPYSLTWSDGSTGNELHTTKPGIYCVTFTDNLGCPVEKCIDLNPMSLNKTPISCTNNIYRFDSSPFSTGNYYPNGSNPGRLTYPIAINVFETGFSFGIFLTNDHCSYYDTLTLPRLVNGLVTTPKHTTCSSCNDGSIQIGSLQGATCENCEIGQIFIFDINDLNTDLYAANVQSELTKGEYYVVVADLKTGCYIGFNKVSIK